MMKHIASWVECDIVFSTIPLPIIIQTFSISKKPLSLYLILMAKYNRDIVDGLNKRRNDLFYIEKDKSQSSKVIAGRLELSQTKTLILSSFLSYSSTPL